ncbi:MAG: hypothetical protein E6G89_14430 [Alphaproteobacteria bacterium]|nr:MAG: hypothetical protein E6G89_14430 [Alphaproteobacteria bacterium]TMJ41075.1 MAG: hypothetical protein E6G87_00330 [Alphaproteobacteria bacterium]
MAKKLIVAGVLGLGLLAAGAVGPTLAGTNIDIGIGLGGGHGGHISCRQGARIVAYAGFRHVRPIDCDGGEYAYRGVRHDSLYRIIVRSRNGQIKYAGRIRRGGGYGGDDYDDGGGYDGGGYDGGYDDGDY